MNARWIVVDTTTMKGKRWHVRFQGSNGKVVVHGENLESLPAAHTAILSVARAHAPNRHAELSSDDQHVVVGSRELRHYVPVVYLSVPPPVTVALRNRLRARRA